MTSCTGGLKSGNEVCDDGCLTGGSGVCDDELQKVICY